MCREGETLKHSVLYKISPLNLPLRAEESIHKRRKKDFLKPKVMVDTKKTVSSRYKRIGTHKHIDNVESYTWLPWA